MELSSVNSHAHRLYPELRPQQPRQPHVLDVQVRESLNFANIVKLSLNKNLLILTSAALTSLREVAGLTTRSQPTM